MMFKNMPSRYKQPPQEKRHIYLFDYPLILSFVFSYPNQILDIAR